MEQKCRYVASGEILFRQNESSTDAYLVVRGQVGIYLRGQGCGVILPLGILRAGEILGEWSILGDLPGGAEAVALGPVELLPIPRSSLTEDLNLMPAWIQNMVANMAERIHQMSRLIASGHPVDTELSSRIQKALAGSPNNFNEVA